MAKSVESDRYALPPLQYDHGDVLMKLGHEQSDWLVVHSKDLSESSPMLRAALSSRWAKIISIDKIEHPRTGEEVRVKTMALKYVDGAYFLEGKEVLLDLRLDAADKARITRAADLRGVPLSAFVRDAVLREAENVMAAELTVTLSAEESQRFLKALDAPFQPNANLRTALARVGQDW